MTRLSTLPPDPATVTPLRTFPVIRNLVADVSENYRQAQQIPAFTPPAELGLGEYRMDQLDIDRSNEFRKCIECWLCQDVCHVTRDHEGNKPAYSGPRFLIRHAELDMHPLDNPRPVGGDPRTGRSGPVSRHHVLHRGVAPYIRIADNAIIPMKERVIDERYDPPRVLMPRWRRRPGRHREFPGDGPRPHPGMG